MNISKMLSNLLTAFFAQGVSLVVSCLSTLIVPKLLGVETFGFWQLFIFYTSYAGVFHLGLNDGVYLIKGGDTLDSINKRSVSSQFKIGLIYETIAAIVIIVGAFVCQSGQREFVLVMMGVYLVMYNATAYCGLVFQAINETKWYSRSVIVSKIVYFACLIVLVLLRCDSFEPYVIAYVISQIAALGYCFAVGGWIFKGGWLGFLPSLKESISSISVGLKLMIANTAGTLILGVMRFAIDSIWGIEQFGQLSLALSLESFFLLFVSQVAMVLFPALRQASEEETVRWFRRIQKTLSMVLPLVYLLYLPVKTIIGFWLPAYLEALEYLILLLPVCVFDGKMNMLCTTYMKVLRKESALLWINLLTVGTCTVVIALFVLFGLGVTEIILVPVALLAIRSIVSECWLSKKMGSLPTADSVSTLLISIVFLLSFLFLDEPEAAFIVTTCYLALLFFNRRFIRSFAMRVITKRKKDD